MKLSGKVSWFGGPDDEGVSPDEGLAFIYDVSDAPQLFLDEQPVGTTGLARRLDPNTPYIACRWDYDVTPREMLLDKVAIVRAPRTGRVCAAFPADWGPHENTGRIADISPGLLEQLGIETDDEVQVIFPATSQGAVTLDKAVIDLSHWDEVESFEKAKAAGVVGIIHKITEGANTVDSTYNQRKVAALDVGLLWGAYHFLRPGDMKEQARFFVDKIGEDAADCGYLLAADHEDEDVSLDDLKAWLHEVFMLTGVRAIIYSGHVLKEQVDEDECDEELAQYKLWLAQYTTGEPDWPKGTWPNYFLWQYTEYGSCPGIPGDSDGALDVNRYNGTAARLRAEWSEGGAEPAPPEPEPEQSVVDIVLEIAAPPNVTVNVRVVD